MTNLPIESGIGNLWMVKQPAAGTIAPIGTAGGIAPRWVDGALGPVKQLDSESYVDGQRFASPSIFTNQVAGEVGDLAIQGTPEDGGVFFAWILGVDTVTGAADPYTHTITSAAATGGLLTIWQKVGSAIGPVRQAYYDAKMSSLAFECSQQQKVSRLTASIDALVAAEIFTSDPSFTTITDDPLLWTEVVGAVTLDPAGSGPTTVYKSVNGESVTIDTAMNPYWGDDVRPLALIEGKGQITRTFSAIITDDTLSAIHNLAIYNTASPAATTKPSNVVWYANMETTYTRSASRSIKITTPKVAIDPSDFRVAAQPDGGPIEITAGGIAIKSGATPAITVVCKCARSTAMV